MKKLSTYSKKRDFSVTPEPAGGVSKGEGRSFVVQKHAARRLHYDFRLELDGVLKSWAIPKGPSLTPGDKRLAVEVEDHPIDYRDFEGTIPRGQYGGGEVIVWDRGEWAPVGDPHEGLKKGHLRFTLAGEKLAGAFSLVRLKARDDEKKPSWLLLKARDEHVETAKRNGVTAREPRSVLTGRTLEEVAAGVKAKNGKTKKSAKKAAFSALEPQLATLVTDVPTEPGWVFEMKLDGYRALAVIDGGEARIASRNGKDWSARFSDIADLLASKQSLDAGLRSRRKE